MMADTTRIIGYVDESAYTNPEILQQIQNQVEAWLRYPAMSNDLWWGDRQVVHQFHPPSDAEMIQRAEKLVSGLNPDGVALIFLGRPDLMDRYLNGVSTMKLGAALEIVALAKEMEGIDAQEID